MACILGKADEAAFSDHAAGRGDAEVTLSHLLRAYDTVLRRRRIAPEKDTRLYRLLLKLFVHPGFGDLWAGAQVVVMAPSPARPAASWTCSDALIRLLFLHERGSCRHGVGRAAFRCRPRP